MKPMLFNTEMVKALLARRKTVTRRVVKAFSTTKGVRIYKTACGEFYVEVNGNPTDFQLHPTYLPGDIIYVRERWRVGAWDIPQQLMAFDFADGTCGALVHIEDREMFLRLVDQSREDARKAKCEYNGVDFVWKKGRAPTRWRPSIHMPKEAARIFLRVTSVRAERLWDSFGKMGAVALSFEEEGIQLPEECVDCVDRYGCPCCNDLDESLAFDEQTGEDSEGGFECGTLDDVRQTFAELWDSTIEASKQEHYGSDADPWVWVIKFERCENPEEG